MASLISSSASATHGEPLAADKARPWWRYPIVWLVIGGPAAVVVASLVTAGIAVRHIDPVLDTEAIQVSSPSEAPAVKARNHAADPALLADQAVPARRGM